MKKWKHSEIGKHKKIFLSAGDIGLGLELIIILTIAYMINLIDF